MNTKREEFGEDKLLEILAQSDLQSASRIREQTLEAVNHFVEDAPNTMILRWLQQPSDDWR